MWPAAPTWTSWTKWAASAAMPVVAALLGRVRAAEAERARLATLHDRLARQLSGLGSVGLSNESGYTIGEVEEVERERDDALLIAERDRAEADKLRAEVADMRDRIAAHCEERDEALEDAADACAELADAHRALDATHSDAKKLRGDIYHLISPIIGAMRMDGISPDDRTVAHQIDRLGLALALVDEAVVGVPASEKHRARHGVGANHYPALAASGPSSLADTEQASDDQNLAEHTARYTEQAEAKSMRRDWTRPTVEMHNMANVSGATLRRACTARGIATSGTKRSLADRLLDAGLTAVEVKEQHGWYAAEETSAAESMQWCPDCPNGCAEGPAAVVAWVNANDGEARYEPGEYLGLTEYGPARIAVRTSTGWDYAAPGDEVVKGERWFPVNPGPLWDGDSVREFTVRRAADTEQQTSSEETNRG